MHTGLRDRESQPYQHSRPSAPERFSVSRRPAPASPEPAASIDEDLPGQRQDRLAAKQAKRSAQGTLRSAELARQRCACHVQICQGDFLVVQDGAIPQAAVFGHFLVSQFFNGCGVPSRLNLLNCDFKTYLTWLQGAGGAAGAGPGEAAAGGARARRAARHRRPLRAAARRRRWRRCALPVHRPGPPHLRCVACSSPRVRSRR